jgi:hypothetical protein
MDIVQLYQDYGLDYKTEGHKHCRPGWVNIECPFCSGNPGYHLSYNLEGDYFLCWRCGWHPIKETISQLLNVTEAEARKIVKQYGLYLAKSVKQTEKQFNIKPHVLPPLSEPIQKQHIKYLQNRNFDPQYLQREFFILGTGPISLLDGLNYKLRIIIPFIWEGREISFDSRDITNKHPYKYMACPLAREIIPHKYILYGRQDKWTTTGIAVEGPTDVWRFGFNSFATSGIKYTPEQVRAIAKIFTRVPVCFDGGEPQAQEQAHKLKADLRFRGVDSFVVDITGDPGAMDQKEANYLVKQLMTKIYKI